MKWKHGETDKEKLEKYSKEIMDKEYIQIKTCCDCEIYAHILQEYDYDYRLQSYLKKVCDIHKQESLQKYQEKIRSKLK